MLNQQSGNAVPHTSYQKVKSVELSPENTLFVKHCDIFVVNEEFLTK
jgi:hypothetical protein